MSLDETKIWEIAAGVAVVASIATIGAWMIYRKEPTEEELEYGRRTFLTESGRIVDGTLLDVSQVEAEDGRTITLLIYDYRIGGVDYECSQDISQMQGTVNAELVRAGYPCSVRYQPGNPQNSIVVAEEWSGLRSNIPFIVPYPDPEPTPELNPESDSDPQNAEQPHPVPQGISVICGE